MKPIAFRRFAAEVRALYAPPLRRPATAAKMDQVLDELAGLGLKSTEELTPATIARFVQAHPTRSRATQIGLLSYARAAAQIAVEQGWLDRSPFASRRPFVRPGGLRAIRRHHQAEEIGRVLAHLEQRKIEWRSHRLFALVSTLAFTGLRRDEALFLRFEDVDQGGGTIRIVPSNENPLKTEASAAEVPAPALLRECLRDWARRAGSEWVFPRSDGKRPWIGGGNGYRPTDQVKAAGRAVGVGGFTPLSLRHSWATLAPSWGLSPLQIQQCLRHTNTRTQEAYRASEIRALSRKLEAVNFHVKKEGPWRPGTDPHRHAKRPG